MVLNEIINLEKVLTKTNRDDTMFVVRQTNHKGEMKMITQEQVKKVIEQFDLGKLKKNTLSDIDEAKLHGYTNDDRTHYVAWVETLVSGSYGQFQDETIAEMFGIEFDKNDKDFLWDDIYQFADEVADELNRVMDVDGQYYFGHHEADGCFGLMYTEEIKEEVI